MKTCFELVPESELWRSSRQSVVGSQWKLALAFPTPAVQHSRVARELVAAWFRRRQVSASVEPVAAFPWLVFRALASLLPRAVLSASAFRFPLCDVWRLILRAHSSAKELARGPRQ